MYKKMWATELSINDILRILFLLTLFEALLKYIYTNNKIIVVALILYREWYLKMIKSWYLRTLMYNSSRLETYLFNKLYF